MGCGSGANPFEVITCPEGQVPALTNDCFSGGCGVSNNPMMCFLIGAIVALIASRLIR